MFRWKIGVAFFAGIVTLMSAQTAKSACWCSDGWNSMLCFGDWVAGPGDHVVTNTFAGLAEASDSTLGCTYKGQPTPTATCDMTGGVTTVTSWEVTGNINFEHFGVSAQTGQTVTADGKCGGKKEVPGFCQCCHTDARIKWKWTAGVIVCGCSDLFQTCSYSKTGTLKEFDGVSCRTLPCTVPQPCNPNCPQS